MWSVLGRVAGVRKVCFLRVTKQDKEMKGQLRQGLHNKPFIPDALMPHVVGIMKEV